MKKYFVVSDIHSFYFPFISELQRKEFDINNDEHILILCGDLFDRGPDSKKVYDFIKSLPVSRRILIRGNHEYLFIDLLYKDAPDYYDISNGTLNTFDDLTDNRYSDFCDMVFDEKLKEIKNWILSDEWVNYFETNNYIFTHSFIPLSINDSSYIKHMYSVDVGFLSFNRKWRNATPKEFENATWGCPWKLAKQGLNKTGKTIVCGHWHTADFFNNLKNLKYKYNLYISNPIFKSKRYKLIGIDACTAVTNKVNVLVFNESDL